MASVLLRRPVLAWALYDWANSAFATTVMAGFFPVFYSAISGSLSTQDAQFWFNVTLAAASLLVAVAAPLLGAVADRGGTRKHLLALFTLLGVLMTAGLAWVHSGQWVLGLALYALGTVGFSASNIFYDSMLTDVSQEEDFDLVSAYGYALGYVGGGLLFAVNVLMAGRPEWFGLADPGEAVRASFLSVAVWWALFTVPILLFVREAPTPNPAPPAQAVREGLAQLRTTFRAIRRMRVRPAVSRGLLALHRRGQYGHQDRGLLRGPGPGARPGGPGARRCWSPSSSPFPPPSSLAGWENGSAPGRGS